MCVVLGYAGYTAVLAGIGAFGPTIVEGLGLFTSQAQSSLYFGLAVSLAGAIGTPLGGVLIDRATQARRRRDAQAFLVALAAARERAAAGVAEGAISGAEAAAIVALAEAAASPVAVAGGGSGVGADGYRARTPTELAADAAAASESTDAATIDIKLNVALPQAVLMTLVGGCACTAGVLLGSGDAPAFFGLLSLGALSLCTSTAGINIAIMAAVRPESRSFAIGLGTLIVHALGDVPAPPIIGALADRLSPVSCAGAGAGAGADGGSQGCTRSAVGLQTTLALTLLWLAWPVLLWTAAWSLAARRSGDARRRRTESALAADGAISAGAAAVAASSVLELRER
jgi:hypothetical protein